MQFFKPENYFEVRRALEQAGRQDLIGSGCDCLIPARPPKEALDRRRRRANRAAGRAERGRSHPRQARRRVSPETQDGRQARQRPPLTGASLSFACSPAIEYELLDFGAGRKLERFGPYVLDRPSPPAVATPRDAPQLWDASRRPLRPRSDGQRGRWSCARPIDAAWQVQFGPLTLELKLTDSGQVGVFPEQAANWQWIAEQVCAAGGRSRS